MCGWLVEDILCPSKRCKLGRGPCDDIFMVNRKAWLNILSIP
jgi:hypothetical protein